MFFFFQVKNYIDIFGKIKNIEKFRFLFGDCSLNLKKVSANFQKIWIFKFPLIFWKWKFADFWEFNSYKYTWSAAMSPISKIAKKY